MTTTVAIRKITSVFVLLLIGVTSTSGNPFESLKQTTVPMIFYPEVVSTNIDKFNTAFSPDLEMIYYSVTSRSIGVTGIASQKYVEGSFEEPEFLPFVDPEVPITDVSISPNGKALYFSTFKDFEGKESGFHFDLWVSRRDNHKWNHPRPLESVINSGGNEFYPIQTNNGNLYFNSDKSGNSDLYYAPSKERSYGDPIPLPPEINTELREADAFVSHDESFMIFVRVNAPEGYGNSDLYISFNQGNGKWTEAKNMGDSINSSEIDGSPYVTPDNRFLIFTTGRKSQGTKREAMSDYDSFKKISNSSKNGGLNFYYVSLNLDDYR